MVIMFTLLPSLYLIGVHYLRQWKPSYYCQQNGERIFEFSNNTKKVEQDPPVNFDQQSITSKLYDNHEYISKTVTGQNHDIKADVTQAISRPRKSSISELADEDIERLINETGFTREDIRAWYEDFLRDCPDGRLSKSKFIEIYQQFYRKGQVTKFCEHAFRLFDKDGSGYIEFMEFLRAVSLTSSKDRERKIGLFFSMYDIDRDGLIGENELRSVVESIYELMGVDISDPSRVDTKVHEMFSKVECDPSGYLGKDQFAKACENDRHIRKLLGTTTKTD